VDRFAILKQNDPQVLASLRDSRPLAYSPVRLDLSLLWALKYVADPLVPYGSAIKAFAHVLEVLGGLHGRFSRKVYGWAHWGDNDVLSRGAAYASSRITY
jgi:hypothetical protein